MICDWERSSPAGPLPCRHLPPLRNVLHVITWIVPAGQYNCCEWGLHDLAVKNWYKCSLCLETHPSSFYYFRSPTLQLHTRDGHRFPLAYRETKSTNWTLNTNLELKNDIFVRDYLTLKPVKNLILWAPKPLTTPPLTHGRRWPVRHIADLLKPYILSHPSIP